MNYNNESKQFVRACLVGDYDTVSSLLFSRGVTRQAKTDGFLFACEFGFDDIAVLIYERGDFVNYIFQGAGIACRNNDYELFRGLLDVTVRKNENMFGVYTTIFFEDAYTYQPFLVLLLSEYHQHFNERQISLIVEDAFRYDLFDLFCVAIDFCNQDSLNSILVENINMLPPAYLRVLKAQYRERFGVNPVAGTRIGPYIPVPIENINPPPPLRSNLAPLYVEYIERRDRPRYSNIASRYNDSEYEEKESNATYQRSTRRRFLPDSPDSEAETQQRPTRRRFSPDSTDSEDEEKKTNTTY